MDGEAYQVTVHGVAKSRTRLSDFTLHLWEQHGKSRSSVLNFVIQGKLDQYNIKEGLLSYLNGKESNLTCRRHRRFRFNLWVKKILWSWKWSPTPVFLPEKSHGQKSLVGYSPWSHKELDTTAHTCMQNEENDGLKWLKEN